MSAGPSSASYSEFLKDIYSSLRNLTAGLNLINQRLDKLTEQLQSFDTRLANQDQMSQNLAARLDTLIQQSETQQIRQTTTGLSLLTELDTLGARQVEPSTGLVELGTRADKLMSSTGLLSKLSFQLPTIPEEISRLPDNIIHEHSPNNETLQEQHLNEPSSTAITLETATINSKPATNAEPTNTKPQLGTNFLILD